MKKLTIVYGSIAIIFVVLVVLVYPRLSDKTLDTYTAIHATTTARVVPPLPVLHTYVEVVDGCDHAFVGDCVNMREGPGIEFPVAVKLRTGVVLKVDESTTTTSGVWYKIL